MACCLTAPSHQLKHWWDNQDHTQMHFNSLWPSHMASTNGLIICSGNALGLNEHVTIIKTYADLLWIAPLGTSLSEMAIKMQKWFIYKTHFNMQTVKWRIFCSGLKNLWQKISWYCLKKLDIFLKILAVWTRRQIWQHNLIRLYYNIKYKP